MLRIIMGSAVSRTADIICKASFFAPCGMTVPFRALPPTISKADISLNFLRRKCETSLSRTQKFKIINVGQWITQSVVYFWNDL